jgi:multidrug efflux pump subunit AcrA (membrane-fusion protein)
VVGHCFRGGSAAGAWYASQPHPVDVTTTAVVTSYPSQQFVVLNATGYVVAQRKAAIASKATGRLEWLGVAEGSTVKAGEIIARLDNRDVVAQAQSAEAAVRAARAALEGVKAEERDATTQLKRNQDLVAKGFRVAGIARRREDAAPIARWPAWRARRRRSRWPRPTHATLRSPSTTR